MNKQKNWYDCFCVPAINVEENSRPGYILYPLSKRRVKTYTVAGSDLLIFIKLNIDIAGPSCRAV
jgi:hypothetical protein